MKRGWLLAVVASMAVAAGCSGGDDEGAAGGASTVPPVPGVSATAGPATTALPPTSLPASSTTIKAVSSTTARPSTTISSTTTRPSTTVTSASTTTALATATCGEVGFGGPGGDLASGIVAKGVACGDATALVREAKAGHNFYSGPRTFTMSGYNCSVVTETTGLPVGHYTCSNGTKTVTWNKT